MYDRFQQHDTHHAHRGMLLVQPAMSFELAGLCDKILLLIVQDWHMHATMTVQVDSAGCDACW